MPTDPPVSNTTEASPRTAGEISWLVRIAEIFSDWHAEMLTQLGAESWKRLGTEYFWIKTRRPPDMNGAEVGALVRWNLPLEHTWPVHPARTDGFIEKAAQALWRKFSPRQPQGIFAGPLNAGSPDNYYKQLASNLRGRLLRLFSGLTAATVDDQAPERESLFCLVGREGLFAGMASPRAANGFHPGGSKFVKVTGDDIVSRAAAKIAEALHYLRLHRPPPPPGAHWLELGASPGGMTMELLKAGYRVTAVDKAALDPRVPVSPSLTFFRAEVSRFIPSDRTIYDALLCDLNGPSAVSLNEVIRLSQWLKPGAPIVLTLKLHGVETLEQFGSLLRHASQVTSGNNLRLLARTHLTCNRHEVTCFFESR
jgi:hypothetical protein